MNQMSMTLMPTTGECSARVAHGTALNYAILWNRGDNARFLLENRADPRAKDRFGRNALETSERERGPNGLREMADLIRMFM